MRLPSSCNVRMASGVLSLIGLATPKDFSFVASFGMLAIPRHTPLWGIRGRLVASCVPPRREPWPGLFIAPAGHAGPSTASPALRSVARIATEAPGVAHLQVSRDQLAEGQPSRAVWRTCRWAASSCDQLTEGRGAAFESVTALRGNASANRNVMRVLRPYLRWLDILAMRSKGRAGAERVGPLTGRAAKRLGCSKRRCRGFRGAQVLRPSRRKCASGPSWVASHARPHARWT